MVEKKRSLGQSARAIKATLAALLKNGDVQRIEVSANQWGHLEVVIGTDRYRGMGPLERVNRVLDHLKSTLDPADYATVSKVWVLDVDEYEQVVGFGESLGDVLNDEKSASEESND